MTQTKVLHIAPRISISRSEFSLQRTLSIFAVKSECEESTRFSRNRSNIISVSFDTELFSRKLERLKSEAYCSEHVSNSQRRNSMSPIFFVVKKNKELYLLINSCKPEGVTENYFYGVICQRLCPEFVLKVGLLFCQDAWFEHACILFEPIGSFDAFQKFSNVTFFTT